jgi:hypothetical protein
VKTSLHVVLSLGFVLLSCRGADQRPDAGLEPGCEPGAVNPLNPCERCDQTSWSPLADGTSCGTGQVCASGTCAARCFINGVLLAAGAVNPDDACVQCDPASSTTQWSARADGTSCGGGEVCVSGACRAKCLIDGGVIDASAINPSNACEQCTPATSTSAWSTRTDGASCGAGQVCDTGVCANKCFIAGALQAANALHPQNPCERCEPASSTTSWTALSNGASCGTGLVCDTAACTAKCFIGGTLVADGAVNPASECQVCAPMTSTTTWSPRALVPLLVGGTDVTTQGWTLVQQAPSMIDYGADFTRLVTSTNSGGRTSGQLLLQRNVGAAPPYTLRAELLVEQVDPHNQFDSAAALLGGFSTPAGTSAQRGQMVYLDANTVGWADDTQSAAIAVTNGQYRTYVLSVDASNVARLSVDGTQVLTRNNFTMNGFIAIGDQTNDPNVDATMRIRSISRVCP